MEKQLKQKAPRIDIKDVLSGTTSPKINLLITPTKSDELKDRGQYLPMLHGKATDTIANLSKEKIEENALNDTGIIESTGIKLVFEEFSKLNSKFGVSTHKLLSVAVANFTNINNTGTKNRKVNYYKVHIPLKEYARLCGYNIDPKTMNTEEDQEKENKRAESSLKNARRKILKDLNVIYSVSLTWKEKVKGKDEDFIDMRLIEYKGIENGYIVISFTQIFSNYLIRLPITQFPTTLLAIDERNANAYSLGLKMVIHSNMDNNIRIKTAQLLKVKTLLSATSLPAADNPTVKRVGWDSRIKEPFEKALDELTKAGVLEDWEYSHSKGVPLTDKEAAAFSSFEEWSNTLVHFTLKDAPDHATRLEERDKEKLKEQKSSRAKIGTQNKRNADTIIQHEGEVNRNEKNK